MARLLRRLSDHIKVLELACLLLSLVTGAAPFYGQASAPNAFQQALQSTGPANMASAPNFYTPQTNTWTPQANGFPNTGGNWNPPPGPTPGPYSRPTREQTQYFVDNHPALKYLPPYMKEPIVNGSLGALDYSMVPYQAYEAFHSSYGGGTIPNWYLPSTWSSPNMNWQGVQPSGYLPTATSTYNAYYPSSISTTYNPSSGAGYNSSYTNYNYSYNYNQQNNRQNSQPSAQLPRPGDPQRVGSLLSPGIPNPSRINSASVVDLKNAIASRERALAVSQAAGDKVAQVSSHAELARLFIQSGKPDQALVHVEAAEPLASAMADTQQRAELLRVKGTAYMVSGDFEHAISAYRESIAAIRSQNDSVNWAELFNRTSWYSASVAAEYDVFSGNLSYSISAFSEPIKDPTSPSDRNAEAEVLTSVGWAYQSMGDVPEALANYKSAKALFWEGGGKDGRVRTQLAIASLYQSIGEWEKAIEEYKQLPETVGISQWIRVLVSVAEIAQSLHQPTQALTRYQKALRLAQPLADPMQEAVILAGIGRCEMALGRYVDSDFHLEEARAKMREAGNRAGEGGVIANLGELQYWQAINSPTNEVKRHFARALDYYNQALPLMYESGDRNGEIGVLANTGLLYDAWRKPGEALNYYLRALQKIEELQVSARLEEFRIDVSDQSAGLYQRAVMLEFGQHHMREAFELSERARARAFLDQISAARSQPPGRLPAEFSAREEKLRNENTQLERQIGQELSKPSPEINAERLQTLQARLAAVRQAYEDAVRDLKISNPDIASLITASPLSLPDIQKQLGPDVTVVSYFTTTTDKTLAFAITRTTFDVVKLPVMAPELATAIATFRDFSGENSGQATLKQLYKWLLAPLKSRLNTSMLAVVPHGPINDLSFAALTPDGEHFVSDKYAVFYLPSVNVLPYLHPKSSTGANSIFALANEESSGSPSLHHAKDEASAVASIWGVQPFLGETATASYIRSHAGDYQIVHLAAHVATDRKNPQFSKVATSADNVDEGELELNQVVSLDLRKTNLVVVSGCESQLGRRSRGDDVISLSRAFMFAGSPSVIASLWNVDDEATQQLMVAFYTHLKAGLTKAEALRAAENDIRKRYPNPYYWAGFVLSGDPGNAGSFNLLASSAK